MLDKIMEGQANMYAQLAAKENSVDLNLMPVRKGVQSNEMADELMTANVESKQWLMVSKKVL